MKEMNKFVCGDARELIKEVPDNSIDLIFTDPPYIKKYMYLYSLLGAEGPRVLKPEGFLIAYVGEYWKDDAMKRLGGNLDYFWDFVSINAGNSPYMWCRKIIARHKSLLCYRNGTKGMPQFQVLDTWVGSGEDKNFHKWGQDESTARYYISAFSKKGDTILEPFAGGGTTIVVCKLLNRNCIAFEIDKEAYNIARARVGEADFEPCLEQQKLFK